MTCEQCREWILTGYLDDELSEAERRALIAHAETCPTCRSLMEKAPEILVMPFRSLPRVAAPPSVWQAVAAEIGDGKEQAPAFPPVGDRPGPDSPASPWFLPAWLLTPGRTWATALAVLVLAVGLAVTWYAPSGLSGQTETDAIAEVLTTYHRDPQVEKAVYSCLHFDTPLEALFL